ncbi:MAG: hypothetical protein JWQ99_289 [Blastococcus sp.]|nr:hypothetical protein [Blastococcus sp.]
MPQHVAAVRCAVLVAGLVGLTSCASDGKDAGATAPSTTTSVSSVATQPPDYPAFPVPDDSVIELASPDWLVDAGDDGIWVKLDHGPALRLDPVTGAILTTAPVAGELCQGLGAGLGYIWSCSDTDIVRIDPASGQVEATFSVSKARQQGNIVVADDRVWVLTGDGSTLLGLDAVSGATTSTVSLDVRGTDLAAGAAGLWVVSSLDGQALRVDPDRGTVDRRVEGLDQPFAIAVTDQVWVSGGSTVRIDPDSGKVLLTSPLGSGDLGGIAIGEDRVWVRNATRLLVGLDPADGAPVVGYDWPDATAGGDVLVAAGAVWVSYNDKGVFRLDPDPTG